jgi:HTH-type transcriptional regulator/antitoxin HigA
MNDIKPIRSEADLEVAKARIERIFFVEPGTPEDDELAVLLDLVEHYEERHHPVGFPDPISAIEFRMEQANLTPRDLAPFIGSRAKVSEVLSGKRAITMAMARALHQHLRIPADVLLQEPGAGLPDAIPDLEYSRFPLKAMAKAGWIENVKNMKDVAEELITELMERAGGREFAAAPLYRKNDSRRINAKTDDYALRAWCWQVLAQANTKNHPADYQAGVVNTELLHQVAQMSVLPDGPVRARDFLFQRGIALEYVPYLPRTHLDGAALQSHEGRPVVGLTLRYDRIDNFWYTLLHELAHVGLHLGDGSGKGGFVDDHSLRGLDSDNGGSKEQEADRWAQDALIPPEVWENGILMEDPSPMAVIGMASQAGVHPAIIAGRVRYLSGNYRFLSQFVGTGEVRRWFGED